MTLPMNLDALGGLRAARWTRSSTKGQADRNGPDAQHEQQDRAIDRYGMVDTGIEWLVAHSGYRKDKSDVAVLASTEQWSEMMAGAGKDYDVLVVVYVSRWARNAELHFTARRLIQQAGAAILFADERLLSSDGASWEQWAREAVEAEAYSRRLGRRVSEGLEAKRRRHGDPGGRPPFGFRRTDSRIPVIEIDEPAMEVVREVFALGAAGHSDLEVAQAVNRKDSWVAEVLTNPIYIGLLRDGNPSAVGPIIPMDVWSAVQTRREGRRTRQPGSERRASAYALRIRCLGCDAYLFGDTGRYRHPRPTCGEFLNAKPEPSTAVRGRHTSIPGNSYPQAWYEGVIELLLDKAAGASDQLIADVLVQYANNDVHVDEVTLARIARERDDATRRLTDTRDVAAWQATMTRLDAEDAKARSMATTRLTDVEVIAYLRDLPSLWADADTAARKTLAAALWIDIAVLGWSEIQYTWSRHAIQYGLGGLVPVQFELTDHELSLVGARVSEFTTFESGDTSQMSRDMRDSRAHVEASGGRPQGRLQAVVRHGRGGRLRDQPAAAHAPAPPLPRGRARRARATFPPTPDQPARHAGRGPRADHRPPSGADRPRV